MAIIPGIYASQISGHLITSNFFIISQQNVSAVLTVTFSSIPSTYKSLQIRFNLTGNNGNFGLVFNSDTSVNNYTQHYLTGNGSTASATGEGSGFFGNTRMLNLGVAGTTYPTVGIIDIIDYANTSKYKVAKTFIGSNANISSGAIELDSSAWLSTAAISSINFMVPSGSAYTGTISLYGVS
jgi:hypothetical protein